MGTCAHYNVCRHRGSQVVPVEPAIGPPAPPCRTLSLRCPYHSWTYDLAGRLLRAPYTEDVDDFAAEGRTASDISAFAMDRPALVDADHPASWLV